MAYPYYPAQYQNYFPANYQPYQPVQQQPQMQTQPQMQQPVQNFNPVSSGIIWVDDEREAALFPIAPNNAVALWEKSGKRAFMKKADATGKPIMTVYDLVERSETASDESSAHGEKVPAYATKEELNVVVGAVKDYSEALSKINADIETMKGDLYGVAGKRKTVKKQTEGDEDDT